MSPAVVRVHVVGVPATQGSSQAFIRRKKDGTQRAVITAANPGKLKPWREAVRSTVVAALGPDWQPLTGPVKVRMLFALPKPASAPKRTRVWPIKERVGDVDKLARAVLDALTDAAVWRTDAQVVDLLAVKDFPGPDIAQNVPGVLITVNHAVPAQRGAT